MSEIATDSGLILSGKTADAFIEARAQELFAAMRQEIESTNQPISFSTRNSHTPIGLGSGPSAAQLVDEQQGWAAIANRATMDRIASIEWFAAERSFNAEIQKFEFEPLPSHILNETLQRPNPWLSGMKLKMLIAGLVNHTGACYLQKLRDGLGVPRELWPIPTQLITPVAADGNVIGAYQVLGANGQTFFLPTEDVIRIWRPDLKTIWGQLGTLGPQALEYDSLKFMTEHLRAYFQQDGTPRVALTAQSGSTPPEPEDRAKLLTAWRRSHNRRLGTQIGLPAFIPEGFGIHEFSADQIDEGMSEFEDRWARQIMAGPGVPRFAVGIDTNVNRATGETTMWAWDQNSNKPLTDLIATDLTTQWAQPDFFPELAVRFERFVAPDKDFELKREDQDLRNAKVSINQVLESEDRDSVSWGDLPKAPFSEQPYTGEVEEDDGFESVNDLRGGHSSDPSGADTGRVVRSAESFFSPDAVWARNLRTEKRFVGKFSTAQLRVWDAQRLETLRRLSETADAAAEDLRSVLDGNAKARRAANRRSPQLERSFNRTISVEDIFNVGVWFNLYAEETGEVRAEVLSASAQEVLEVLAPDVGEFVLSGFVEQELAAEGGRYVTQVDTVTRNRIAAALAEAQPEESINQIAKRLDAIFRDRKRSRTVARTEVGSANQAGTIEGFRLSNAVEGKQWNTSRDGAVRDSHQIDGQTVQIDETFELRSGVRADHPLQRSLPAGEIVNCRCFVTPVLIEEPT